MKRIIALEPSTNTHQLTEVETVSEIANSTLKVRVGENSKVIHGEHGSFAVESEHIIKYVQQELNPITKKLQNAWD
jgi:hypothetical protein